MCKQLAHLAQTDESAVYTQLLQSPLTDLYERGQMSTEELHKKFSEIFQANPSIEEFKEALSDIFTANDEMAALFHELKQNNVTIIALSNTCPAHFEYAISHYPILKEFDDFILSYEVGARKPEEKIFTAALAKTSSEINLCFYTDDIDEYVQTARSMGIPSHTFSSVELLKKSLTEHGFLTKHTI